MLQINISPFDRNRLNIQRKVFKKKISQGEPYFCLKIVSSSLEDFNTTVQLVQNLLTTHKSIFLGPLFFKSRLKIPTRKSPIGTGSETWDRWVSFLYKVNYKVNLQGPFISEISKRTFPSTVSFNIDLKH